MENSPSFDAYYLFKGIAKAIPIVGPVLEELIFNQYESVLNESGSTEETFNRIVSSIESNDQEIRAYLSDYMLQHLKEIKSGKEEIVESQSEIKGELDTIKGILLHFSKDYQGNKKLSERFAEVEEVRALRIERISKTQKKILSFISTEPESSMEIFKRVYKEIPSLEFAREKELHLRLHELRYLGLVGRKKVIGNSDWFYWRVLR